MKYQLRPYQQAASDAAVKFFLDDTKKHNGLIVASTGCGKSLIIADIAYRLDTDVLVFTPSKEILQQNYEKMCSYGVECSMYSASVGQKVISKVTFCTIGSVRNYAELFQHFKYILIDECHLVNPKAGMYKKLLSQLKRKVIGLTASPFRLETSVDMDWRSKKPKFGTNKAWLQMLTDYRKPIFKEIIYNIQIDELLEKGYLAKLKYFDLPPSGWNERLLKKNTSGTEFTNESISAVCESSGFDFHLIDVVKRLMNPKDGTQRNGILAFVRFVEDAKRIAANVDSCEYICGDMDGKERDRILQDFASGKIKVLVNSNILVQGYDRPDLDTVVLASPTMSLARYYQEVGRIIRPHPSKGYGWVVDLVGNVKRFGEVSHLRLLQDEKGHWNVLSNEKQLTNVIL